MKKITDELYIARSKKVNQPAPWDELIATIDIDKFILPVKGDCLEGLGVVDRGFLLFDRTKMPLPNVDDICLCRSMLGDAGERNTAFVKRYAGLWGPWHSVNTCRKGEGVIIQSGFFVSEIYATACACYASNGSLVWEKDLSGNPSELITKPTIKGVNMNDPMEVAI